LFTPADGQKKDVLARIRKIEEEELPAARRKVREAVDERDAARGRYRSAAAKRDEAARDRGRSGRGRRSATR
jgi:hypothetical protein